MLQIRNLSNAMQKRLIRPLYAHTQATPYAATLDPLLRNTDGSFRQPLNTEVQGGMAARTASAFVLQGGLVPGTCMVKNAGEAMLVHNGANTATVHTFGLLANFVGGTLDDLKDNNEIGVWRGPDATFELLSPAWDSTGLSALYAAATAGSPVEMCAGPDGRLLGFAAGGGGNREIVARLVEWTPSRINITLQV